MKLLHEQDGWGLYWDPTDRGMSHFVVVCEHVDDPSKHVDLGSFHELPQEWIEKIVTALVDRSEMLGAAQKEMERIDDVDDDLERRFNGIRLAVYHNPEGLWKEEK